MAPFSLTNTLLVLMVTASLSQVSYSEEVWVWGSEAPLDPGAPLPIQGQGSPSVVAPTDDSRVDAGRLLGSHSNLCGNGLGNNCHHGVNNPSVATNQGLSVNNVDLISSYTSYDSQDTSLPVTNTQNTLPLQDNNPPKKYKPTHHGAIAGFIKSIGNKIHSIFPSGHKKHQKPILSLPNTNYQVLKPTYTTPHFIQTSTFFEPSFVVESSYTKQSFSTALHNLQPSIITHVHTHTHIHQGVNYQTPAAPSTVTITPVLVNVNTFAKNQHHLTATVTTTVHHHPATTVVPTIVKQQTQSTIIQSASNAANINGEYLPPTTDHISVNQEQCLCMPEQYCPAENIVSIVPKTNPKGISHLIDARNRKTDILSNVNEDEEVVEESSTTFSPIDEVTTEEFIDEDTTEEFITEATSVSEEEFYTTISPIDEEITEETSTDLQSASEDFKETRVKRSLEFVSLHGNIKLDKNGRQINGYAPGHGGCGEGHVCCQTTSHSIKKAKSIQTNVCGKSKTNSLLGRIKTANLKQGETQFAEYPWQAAILKKGNNGTTYLCGAVLIDDRHVLTAAHCVNGVQSYDIVVRLGEWDFSQDSEFFQHIDLQVSQVFEHENYYKGNLDNDITALRLNSILDFNSNPHISPVCLPATSSNFNNQLCTVTGWGKDDYGNDGQFQRILQEVSVPVVERQKCQEALRQTRLGNTFNLQESMMCAGGKQYEDACKGDGGSPLVCLSNDGTYQLAGLVSWGIGCGQEGIPGVYVDVTKNLPWIHNVRNL